MKRIWVAAGLILFAVGVCSAGYISMNKSVGKLVDILREGSDAAEREDYFAAADIATDAKKQWKKTKPLLEVFVNHQEISDLSDYLDLIEDTAQNGDIVGFDDICKQSVYHLTNILDAEKPSVETIL